MSDYDVIVVGGGSAAVSVAWPLVEAGHRVLMLDQGDTAEATGEWTGSFLHRRLADPTAWRQFLGADFSGLGGDGRETPKMKVPAYRYVLGKYADAYGIEADGIVPVGTLARGGLSLMWGAGAYPYSAAEMSDWPVSMDDMVKSYVNVARRMGISGHDDLTPYLGVSHPLQDPLPLHPAARRLLDRYRAVVQDKNSPGFVLGHARNAVLTEALEGRAPCDLRGMCLWGCERDAIYRADLDIDRLSRAPNFRYEKGAFVDSVAPDGDGWRAHTRDLSNGMGARRFTAKTMVLAAGTLGSTVLALKQLGLFGQPVGLACHPAFAFAVWIPSRLGAAWQEQNFALGQLAYQLGDRPDRPDVFGILFSCEGLLATDIVKAFPFTSPRAAILGRALLPSILIANGYLPSTMSNCRLSLEKNGNRYTLKLSGGFAPGYEATVRKVAKRLRRAFRGIGAISLPGSFRTARLGSDAHYGGTIPMRADEGGGRPSCRPDGEVRGLEGLYVADGAALPHLPVKHPTFTIMANADRIGHALATRLRVAGR